MFGSDRMGAAASRTHGDQSETASEGDSTFLEALGCCNERGAHRQPRRILLKRDRDSLADFERPWLLGQQPGQKLQMPRSKSPDSWRRSVSPTASYRSGLSTAESTLSDGYGGGVEPHFWA